MHHRMQQTKATKEEWTHNTPNTNRQINVQNESMPPFIKVYTRVYEERSKCKHMYPHVNTLWIENNRGRSILNTNVHYVTITDKQREIFVTEVFRKLPCHRFFSVIHVARQWATTIRYHFDKVTFIITFHNIQRTKFRLNQIPILKRENLR